ncbi:MAG: sulfite exporter TauE/SafE family protein [Anaerolineae bacterium]|nr:sulfite exporter TauE/SafE family protein [Anaerolineae bacterium]
MEPWQFFAALVGISFGAGLLGALLGLGGGVILVPVLTLLLGVDIRYAIAASIVSVIATSSGAAAAYVRDGITNMRIGMFLETGTTAGAVTGALVGGVLTGRVLYVLFAVIIAYCAYAMFRKRGEEAPRATRGDALAGRLRLGGAYYDAALGRTVEYHATNTLPVLGLTYVAGMVSGLLGIGGGPLKVPAMDIAMRLPIKVSTATSNFMIGVTAAASAAIYFMRGQVHPAVAAPVAVGVLGGAVAGARLMGRVRGQFIRLLFSGLLAILAVQMLLKGLG